MKRLSSLLLLLLLAGCANEKRFVKFHDNHTAKANDYCRIWNPLVPETRVIVNTDTIIGKEYVVDTQFVTIDCDTVKLPGEKVRVPVPKYIVRHDTIVQHEKVTVVDQVAVMDYRTKAKLAEDKLAKKEKQLTQIIIIGAIGLLVAFVVGLVIGFLSKRA